MTIEEFLTQLCEHCGIEADMVKVTSEEVEDRLEIQLTIPEEESGRFIGYHGDALQAIQRVLRLAFETQLEKKIVLNVNDYRERRLAQLEEKVRHIAEQVLADGQPYTFSNFIPSHERYAIHTVLATVPGAEQLESFSQGDGMNRRLTIALRSSASSEGNGVAAEPINDEQVETPVEETPTDETPQEEIEIDSVSADEA